MTKLYINGEHCLTLEQLKSYFSQQDLTAKSDTYNDLLEAGKYGDLEQWLQEHNLDRVSLICVDKYGRESFNFDCSYSMTLEDLYKIPFDFVVEDSPIAFEHIVHFNDCVMAIFDRPWNKKSIFPNENFNRCSGWEEIDKLLKKQLNK